MAKSNSSPLSTRYQAFCKTKNCGFQGSSYKDIARARTEGKEHKDDNPDHNVDIRVTQSFFLGLEKEEE